MLRIQTKMGMDFDKDLLFRHHFAECDIRYTHSMSLLLACTVLEFNHYATRQ